RLVDVPTVHTLHICPTPEIVRYCRMYPEGRYVLISEFRRGVFEDVPVAGVVHSRIDPRASAFSGRADRYLSFHCRLRAGAGPRPEIVAQGVGGIHVQEARSLAPAIERVRSLDRAAVRRLAVERFDLSRMVDGYVRIFERALGGGRAWRRQAAR